MLREIRVVGYGDTRFFSNWLVFGLFFVFIVEIGDFCFGSGDVVVGLIVRVEGLDGSGFREGCRVSWLD